MRFSYSWTFKGRGSLSRITKRTVLPTEMTARFDFEGEDHDVEMDVVVKDGKPQVDQIRVLRADGLPPLDGTELRRIPFTDWLQFACAQAGILVQGEGNLGPPTDEDEARQVADDVGRATRRRVITDDLLRRVADLHKEGGYAEVMSGLPCGDRQAYRYVREARERGIMPPKGKI